MLPYLVDADLFPAKPSAEQLAILTTAAPLVQERIATLAEAVPMLSFLFVPDETFALDPEAAAKTLGSDAKPVLNAAIQSLDDLPEWAAAGIEQALKACLIEELNLKPRKAFAPVRVAITGSTISPPLYESMELLGRDRVLARLKRALER